MNAVDGVMQIVEVRLNDTGEWRWHAAGQQRTQEELRLLYSSVIVRAVNGLTGFEQKVKPEATNFLSTVVWAQLMGKTGCIVTFEVHIECRSQPRTRSPKHSRARAHAQVIGGQPLVRPRPITAA